MNGLRYWSKLIGITLGKLCRHRLVLAGIALLCLCLPLCIAPAAEYALSEGVSFSGVHLAVTGEADDAVPELLEQVLAKMTDVSRYCRVSAMGKEEAIRSLEQGDVTAVLALPEDFIRGIMNGTNPDVELIVSPDRPLESQLTLWLGQSASDLLAAVQSGIYAVLEIYQIDPPAGMSYSDAVAQINLRYVNWTFNRQDMYREQTIAVTEQLPVVTHYALSLLVWLVLSAAPLFVPVYEKGWISAQRRLRAVGHGMTESWFAALSACFIAVYPVLLAVQLLVVKGSVLVTILTAAVCSLFCAAFVSLCCLLTSGVSSCGVLSFLLGLVFLALSGGVLPPVMMPGTLRGLLSFSPITWLRSVMAWSLEGFEPESGMLTALLAATVLMTGLGAVLYRRRGMREERV